ncbi:hypothetical protein MKEN_00749300 [Mycena kentingensis (nom. inval.)]|nr:hypothetical protein MKEN_00749300 [Mycena kentingensis (nom. inval.)]
MAPVVVPGVDLPLLTGPLVLGYMWGYGLYGAFVVQFYLYLQVFKTERVAIKVLVWATFVMETAFTVLCTVAAWNNYGPGWGDLDTLVVIDWSWQGLPPLNGFLAALAQSFYMWRIYRLTRRLYLPALIGCVSTAFWVDIDLLTTCETKCMLTQLTAVLYYGISVSVDGHRFEQLNKYSMEITLWLVSASVSDLLIASSLVIILWRQRQRAQFQRTTEVIDRLIRYAIETGSLTSACAITEVVLWLGTREYNFHFIFFLLIGRLYSNTLMATLNSRAAIPVYRDGETTSGTNQHTSVFWNEPGASLVSGIPSRSLNLAAAGGVHISRTTEVDHIAMSNQQDFKSGVDGEDHLFEHQSATKRNIH